MIMNKLGREKVRICVHFFTCKPLTRAFVIHFFFFTTNITIILSQKLLEKIPFSPHSIFFVKFIILINNFALLHYMYMYFLVSITQLTETLGECSEYGLILVDQMEKAMYNTNIYPNSNTSGCSAVMLEHSLFEIGASPDVVKGVFYLLPIFYEGKLFLR